MENLKNELKDAKKELEEVRIEQHETFATEILRDYKRANKRLFIIWVITFLAFVALLGYLIYLLNDISYVETTTDEYTQEITEVDTISGSTITNGGN